MKWACFQNTLRKRKKKKALHRGTFEVVEIFSFQRLAPERERERERAYVPVFHCAWSGPWMWLCVCPPARRNNWTCKPYARGHLRVQRLCLRAGTPVPVHACGFVHAFGFPHACSRWLESSRGPRMAACLSVLGGGSIMAAGSRLPSTAPVALSAQRKRAMSRDTAPCHAPGLHPVE